MFYKKAYNILFKNFYSEKSNYKKITKLEKIKNRLIPYKKVYLLIMPKNCYKLIKS